MRSLTPSTVTSQNLFVDVVGTCLITPTIVVDVVDDDDDGGDDGDDGSDSGDDGGSVVGNCKRWSCPATDVRSEVICTVACDRLEVPMLTDCGVIILSVCIPSVKIGPYLALLRYFRPNSSGITAIETRCRCTSMAGGKATKRKRSA